jgi:hypothetical protein
VERLREIAPAKIAEVKEIRKNFGDVVISDCTIDQVCCCYLCTAVF